MGKNRHFIIVAVLIVVSTLVLKFGVFDIIWRLPAQASAEGRPIDTMFQGHFWMISFLFALIMVMVLYSVFVFRRQSDDDTDGPHIHGNTTLEIIWTIVPVFIVIGFGIWGAVTFGQLLEAKPDEMVVGVTGKQWSWSFDYPEYDFTSAALVLPKGQPILLEMESEDVLHSFWVPEFRVKQDLVPGRVTTLRFTPTKVGDYKLRCAEICGLEHAGMLADVQVLEQGAYDAWLQERLNAPKLAELSAAERGAIWYGGEGFGCVGCHTTDGTPAAGPSWLGLVGREEQLTDGTTVIADEDYIRNSILNPQAQIVAGYEAVQMQGNYGDLFAEKEAEVLAGEGLELDIIADIIAFMETLEE